MNRASRILLILVSLIIPTTNVVGQRNGVNSKRAVNTASEANFGYHGPVKLGPFSINNRVGGIEFHKLLSMMGGAVAPNGMYVCYYDEAEKIYLVVERGVDDPSLVRGLTLSRINVCPETKFSHASHLSTWVTDEGIRLGSSAKDVIARYGEPSHIDELRTDPEFTFSPYDLKPGISGLPKDGRIFSYLPKDGEPDTSHAFFGIRSGVVVWITVSDNE